jgi:16S rRNA (uracil1498-N3)-methyltransferase
MADRFYTPDALGPGEAFLEGPEAHHLTTVRRFGPGDEVILFNGDGNEYPAQVVVAGKKRVTLHIHRTETIDRELPFPLVVASTLPKADRADFLLEKLTELGVTRFIPLLTERAIVRPKPHTVEKFTRGVIEASKQCGRNRLMAVDEPRDWRALLAMRDLPGTRFVLHTGQGLPRPERSPEGVVVAIGPEGGFTAEELTRATDRGWQLASLGPRVLRVETAAVAAAARLSNGSW